MTISQGRENPLLTFAVAAFSQEGFIEEAVEAALAQTYSPLEVILSDDCSKDGTFRIMQQMASRYRGRHRVILNRNPFQRGIGGHVNRILELAHGELIVDAAGDDISVPHRTQVIYDTWERSGRQATSIHSDYVQIDESGNEVDALFHNTSGRNSLHVIDQKVDPVSYVQTLDPIVFGCTHAFSPHLFRVFGNLSNEVVHEDNALALRSILAGRLFFVNEPLVKYRVHSRNVHSRRGVRSRNLRSLALEEDRLRRHFRNREIMYQGFVVDLEKARIQGLRDEVILHKAIKEALRGQKRFELYGKFVASGLFRKCQILAQLKRDGISPEDFAVLMRRLVPRPLFLRIRLGLSYAALARERWRRKPQRPGNVLEVSSL